MKNIKILRKIFILIALIFINQACTTVKTTTESKNNGKSELFIFQNGVEIPINTPLEKVEIDKKGFALRFFNKRYNSETKEFYSAQIAAFIDKSEFDKIQIGMQKADLPCFKSGSGMAADKDDKYKCLILEKIGHHYLFYENAENNRLTLLDDSRKLLKLEFEINALYYNNVEVEISDTQLNEFYLAFLIDKNLNGIIDEGELNKLTIIIK